MRAGSPTPRNTIRCCCPLHGIAQAGFVAPKGRRREARGAWIWPARRPGRRRCCLAPPASANWRAAPGAGLAQARGGDLTARLWRSDQRGYTIHGCSLRHVGRCASSCSTSCLSGAQHDRAYCRPPPVQACRRGTQRNELAVLGAQSEFTPAGDQRAAIHRCARGEEPRHIKRQARRQACTGSSAGQAHGVIALTATACLACWLQGSSVRTGHCLTTPPALHRCPPPSG